MTPIQVWKGLPPDLKRELFTFRWYWLVLVAVVFWFIGVKMGYQVASDAATLNPTSATGVKWVVLPIVHHEQGTNWTDVEWGFHDNGSITWRLKH